MKRIARDALRLFVALMMAYVGGPVAMASERVALLAQAAPEAQPAPTPQQRVAMLKQWLQASQAQIRGYEWIETTVIAKGGEEKSRKQNSCYYGVDGALQKVPLASDAEADSGPRGPLRKRIAASKKEEVTDYMQSAAALIHEYVPPDANRIQQAVNSGTFSVSPSAGRARLTFKSYLKPNDELNVDVELPTNRLIGLSVASYLEDAKDAVHLDVEMGLLPDGTIFAHRSTLAAPAKDITVVIENTGHRPAGR
jgi:hypothetical protein